MTGILTAIKSNAIHKAFVVYDGSVAHLCGAVGNFDLACISLANGVDLALDLLVGDGSQYNGCFDSLIAFNADFRLYIHFGFENYLILIHRNNVKFGT